MAEYIDREVAKKMLDEYRISRTMSMYGDMDLLTEWRDGVKCSMNKLDDLPTADVVPKSEVDNWQERCGEWHEVAELKSQRIVELEAELSKAKADVAREIFEEIEKVLEDCTLIVDDNSFFQLARFGKNIAELKKKYTEGET